MPTLTIQLAGLPPVSHVLKDETSTIGRMKGNTVVIDDASISLTHAKITRKNGEYFLKDLNSTNGTEINGQPVNEARLHDLDRVKFAGIAAQFFFAEASVPASQTAPTLVNAGTTAPVPQPITVPSSPPPRAQAALPTPSPAPAPRPAPATSPAAKPSAPRAPKPRSRPTAPVLAACAGGVSVLVVLGVVGWKLWFPPRVAARTSMTENRSLSPSPSGDTRARTLPSPAIPNATPAAEPSGDEVSQLIAALNVDAPADRRRAARALHSLGLQAPEAVPALRAALKDSDQEVRMWAALTLINDKCYDKATIPILVGVLKQENAVLRQVACLSLALIPYGEAEKQTVIAALTETANNDTDDETRRAAVSALDLLAPDVLAKTHQ